MTNTPPPHYFYAPPVCIVPYYEYSRTRNYFCKLYNSGEKSTPELNEATKKKKRADFTLNKKQKGISTTTLITGVSLLLLLLLQWW